MWKMAVHIRIDYEWGVCGGVCGGRLMVTLVRTIRLVCVRVIQLIVMDGSFYACALRQWDAGGCRAESFAGLGMFADAFEGVSIPYLSISSPRVTP